MKTLIIVSKCLRVIKGKASLDECHFHFRGVCAGESLRKVVLLKPTGVVIKKGEDYLMYVQFLACKEGILKGKIIKAKPLDECWDNS